jgi:two-component system sensor histidine kinase DegS
MSQIISIQEEERRRLAWELHDETAQMLATTLVTLRAAEQAPDQGRAQELIGRALAQQVQALADIRRIIYALRPAALDDLGLVSALRAYTEDRLVAKGISIQFEVMGEDNLLTKPVQTAVFRILQEAVNNIAKHAEAQKVSFRLKFHHQKLEVTVEDDGKGFDLEQALSRDQVGIQGMKERAEIIGAQLVLKSTPGSGTIVCLTVPLYPEEGEGG